MRAISCIARLPCRGLGLGRQAQIAGVAAPELRLLGRTERHPHIAAELGIRADLPARALRKKGADRLRRPPQLIGNAAILLGFGKAWLARCNSKDNA